MIRKLFLNVMVLMQAFACLAQDGTKERPLNAVAFINTRQGHVVVPGASGFNVRIGDKVWGYQHPDFIKAVHELKPGWLRYWSGTAGDAFCMATGQYDKEYINLFDKGDEYEKLYQFSEVKGPQRITDLYHLLGTEGGKLVVTVNAFTETPEMTAELARFCKNNNIEVEAWQFCNEPYFYVPGRQRYWWNDGYDYAQKMKPHADSIKKIFPHAKLALNYTWDGVWGFMKEINTYQKDKGAFWNVFSKHSYAPHTGKEESFDEAYKRMNSKLLEVTGDVAMKEVENWTWKGAPMLITEFGVWNKPLNGIISAIYNAEYTLRQLSHPNTWLIGSHEISNKARPVKNLNQEILKAYEKNEKINTMELATGVELDDEGKAMKILHEATNNAVSVWPVNISGAASVPGMNNTTVPCMYALGFKGANGYDYLAVTNRSNQWHDLKLEMDGKLDSKTFHRTWMMSESSKASNVTIQQDEIQGKVSVAPNSVMLLKWENDNTSQILPTRIYDAAIKKEGIKICWWPSEVATSYDVLIKDETSGKAIKKSLQGKDSTSFLFSEAIKSHVYTFKVNVLNKKSVSPSSSAIKISYVLPGVPAIFKTAPRDNGVTIFWHSVPGAKGYKVKVEKEDGSWKKEYDADNVFGYKIKELEFDTPYRVSVITYNGLGESKPSESVSVTCKKNIPLPPSNISAIENNDGSIALKWNAPKQFIAGTRYKLYRGEQPHVFTLLKDGLLSTAFIDSSAQKGSKYYYTVKSYTSEGECSFYPNMATIIRSNQKMAAVIESIRKTDDGYEIAVQYSNIPTDGESSFGVLLSDVSYLNGEETKFVAANRGEGRYTVIIPLSALKPKAIYSIKASIQTNGGTPFVSLPPHKEFKVD